MTARKERVVFLTERFRITGVLNLPGEGYGNRMTDYINATERHFISLTDVEMQEVGRDVFTKRDFLAISRHHIVLAMPADEQPAP